MAHGGAWLLPAVPKTALPRFSQRTPAKRGAVANR